MCDTATYVVGHNVDIFIAYIKAYPQDYYK